MFIYYQFYFRCSASDVHAF